MLCFFHLILVTWLTLRTRFSSLPHIVNYSFYPPRLSFHCLWETSFVLRSLLVLSTDEMFYYNMKLVTNENVFETSVNKIENHTRVLTTRNFNLSEMYYNLGTVHFRICNWKTNWPTRRENVEHSDDSHLQFSWILLRSSSAMLIVSYTLLRNYTALFKNKKHFLQEMHVHASSLFSHKQN